MFFFPFSGFIRLTWILPLSHCYVFSQQWIIFSLLLKHVVIFTLQPPNPVLAAHTFLSVTILPHFWPEQRNLWYFWLLLFLHKLRPLPVYTDTCPVYINGYVICDDLWWWINKSRTAKQTLQTNSCAKKSVQMKMVFYVQQCFRLKMYWRIYT